MCADAEASRTILLVHRVNEPQRLAALQAFDIDAAAEAVPVHDLHWDAVFAGGPPALLCPV